MHDLFRLTLLCLFILVSGCSSPSEVIRVAEPLTQKSDDSPGYIIEGHTHLKEIKNENEIKEIKEIIGNSKNINEPTDIISAPPSVFFELYEPENSVSIFRYFLWHESGKGAVIMDSEGIYFELNKEQTKTLLSFLNE